MKMRWNLHPFIDSFDEVIEYRTHIDQAQFFTKKGSNFHMHGIANTQLNPSKKKIRKAKRNARVFALMNRVNTHKDIVREFVTMKQIYSDKYLEEMYQKYGPLFSSRREMLETVLGNYVDPEKVNHRPLSKLFKDLTYEFSYKSFWDP